MLNAQDENCTVIFKLKDTAKDGWGNGKLTVSYDNTSYDITFLTGAETNHTMQIPTGTYVTVKYTVSTSYTSWELKENSFTIEYESGDIVVSAPEEATMVDGATYNFTVDCSPKAPATPTLKAIATGASTIKLTITAPNADRYNVYQNGEILVEGLTETTYTVEGLTANTRYCYTVKSFNDAGGSELSETACVTTYKESSIVVSVPIGDGEIAVASAPIYDVGGYNYTLSQQIYTAKEISLEEGTSINGISFHHATGNNNTRDIVVYLTNVDKGQFNGNYDWAAFSKNDIVYQGYFEFGKADDWVTINFQNGFEYTGGNIALTVYDQTGTNYGYAYELGDKFYSSQVNECRGLYYCNGNAFNQYATNLYGTKMNTGNYNEPKNVYFINNVMFSAVVEPVAPTAPANVVATANGINSIIVTWDAVNGAESYTIYQDTEVVAEGLTATTYTVEGLTAGTNYCFKVIAVNGVGESEASAEVCATTLSPSVNITPNEIVFGDIRLGNYWTEKGEAKVPVTIEAKNTKITGISIDNDSFKLPQNIDLSANKIEFDLTCNLTEAKEYTATLKVAYEGSEDPATVEVRATAYDPAQGDVWEIPIPVTFENNTFTHTATGMHDDYILPDEAEDGNLNDAVYQFTLANDAVVTANVNGTNAIAAIYKAEELQGNGPSSDNNYTGGQSGPTAPTTFFYDFNDGDLSDFTLIEKDTETAGKYNHTNNWEIVSAGGPDLSKCLISYSWKSSPSINNANNIIMTKDMYNISESSQLSFDIKDYSGYVDAVKIEVSTDGESFTMLRKVEPSDAFSTININIGADLVNAGLNYGNYYIALHHDEHDKMQVLVDNLQLTDGSAKSRTRGAQIDGVQYPAGTYYLVAAAEGDFTLNLSLPAPESFAYTAPENNTIVEDTNPKLTWESAKNATSYDVYLGTTIVAEDITTTSYKTTGLSNNTKYYWKVVAKNSIGETEGATWSFVTPLDIPENVTASSNEIYPNANNVTITWNAITGVKGYNVYVKVHGEGNGIKHNGEQLVNTNSYSLSNMDYSQNGHIVYVTAVYEFDGEKYESEISKTETIKVTDYGKISGTITGATNSNGIDGVNITVTGTDEFGKAANYTATTDEDGKYSFDNVLVGNYSITVSKDDYITNTILAEVIYNVPITANIKLLSPTDKIDDITATIISDDKVRVSWNANFDKQDNVKYNVYRKKSGTETDGELIETVTDKEYTDTDWAELSTGSYQYGVNILLKETSTQAYYCGFESGLNGWTKTGSAGTSNYYGYYYKGTGLYFGGEVGTHSITSSSSIDLKEYNDVTLKFYLKNNYGGNYPNTLKVKVKKDNSDWKEIYTTDTYMASYNLVEITLPSDYVGQSVQLQFECTATSNSYTCIDEIEIIATQKEISRQIVWSSDVIKAKVLTFTNNAGDNKWENAANWDGNALPGENDNVIIAAEAHINSTVKVKNLTLNGGILRLLENALLTVSETLTDNNDTGWLYSGSIFAKDGAQIIQNNDNLKATFTMNINNPSEEDMANWANPEVVMSKTGWQFIASPVKNVGFTVIATDGGLYDLYKYDGTAEKEWDNYKDKNDNSFGSAFELGVGYLASHATKTTISLLGIFNSAKEHTYDELTFSDTKELANFHLLGNPFTFDMDMRKAEYTDLIAGVAIVNENGGYTYVGAGNEQTTIPVGDGFFVKAIGTEPSLYYNHNNEVEPAARGSEKANSINVIATSKAGQDNVVINFAGQKEGFNKLQNFNDEIATVFVANNGKRYGIANVEENVAEVELSFVASQMGHYSISLDVNGEFETVTLVDRFTGIETNMLLEDEYNFTATSNDSQNRFVIRLANGQEPTANSQFVYQSGEELILSIEGTVQIVDMLGRVVYSNEHSNGSNRISVAEFNNAAYVVRVVNEEGVKSQKVVIY